MHPQSEENRRFGNIFLSDDAPEYQELEAAVLKCKGGEVMGFLGNLFGQVILTTGGNVDKIVKNWLVKHGFTNAEIMSEESYTS